MGRSEKLAKNISFITIGNIGSKLVGFFMLPFYTIWLSPTDYGITDLLTVYAQLMLNVVACDMGDAICIFPIGVNEQKVRNYYSTGFFFQIGCSLVCLVLFYGISLFHVSGTFGENLWFIYGILISALFQTYTQNFCRGINKMAVFSYTGILQTGAIAFFSFLLIPTLNVYGFVLGGGFVFFGQQSVGLIVILTLIGFDGITGYAFLNHVAVLVTQFIFVGIVFEISARFLGCGDFVLHLHIVVPVVGAENLHFHVAVRHFRLDFHRIRAVVAELEIRGFPAHSCVHAIVNIGGYKTMIDAGNDFHIRQQSAVV